MAKQAEETLLRSSLPGLNPVSNWPVSLQDLIEQLTKVTIEDLFHQPFDENFKLTDEITTYIQNDVDFINQGKDVEFHTTSFKKAVAAFLHLKILTGSFEKLVTY